MGAILSGIQGLVNLLGTLVIIGTLIISWVYADRLSKRHNAEFPWGKALSIVGIEILVLIGINIFFALFKAYWPWVILGTIVVLYLISRKKKRFS